MIADRERGPRIAQQQHEGSETGYRAAAALPRSEGASLDLVILLNHHEDCPRTSDRTNNDPARPSCRQPAPGGASLAAVPPSEVPFSSAVVRRHDTAPNPHSMQPAEIKRGATEAPPTADSALDCWVVPWFDNPTRSASHLPPIGSSAVVPCFEDSPQPPPAVHLSHDDSCVEGVGAANASSSSPHQSEQKRPAPDPKAQQCPSPLPKMDSTVMKVDGAVCRSSRKQQHTGEDTDCVYDSCEDGSPPHQQRLAADDCEGSYAVISSRRQPDEVKVR